MTISEADNLFEQVVFKIDPQGKLLRTWTLHGGISAQMTAIEMVFGDGQTKKLVVRRYDAGISHLVANEYKLLQVLQKAGSPTQTPYYLDLSTSIFPVPYVVFEYVEGTTEFSPADVDNFIDQFAAALAQIHQVNYAVEDLSFLPNYEAVISERIRQRPPQIDTSLEEGCIRDKLEAAFPFPRLNNPVLLHGDFWLGNVIWRDSRIAAVIDWEDAAIGDPIIDLGISRLEILWAIGIEAMHRFTEVYQSLMPMVDLTYLPYWDLRAALRPVFQIGEWAEGWADYGRNDVTEETMREGHRVFVEQAFEKLSHIQ